MKQVYYICKETGELINVTQEYFRKYIAADDNPNYQKLTKVEYDLCALAQKFVYDNYV